MFIFRKRIGLSLAPLIVILLALNPAGAGQAQDLLDGLELWLEGTVDLQGAFEQELLSGALGAGIEENGNFFVLRPGRLRFDYRSPERKVAVINDGATLFWVEEDEQTTRGQLDSQNDLLLTLLAGERPLGELFDPAIDVGPTRRGRARLRLVPRSAGEQEPFTELILTLRLKGFALESVELLDSAGNRMLYRFLKLRRNVGVPVGLFSFVPPDGS